ncbi:MFS transporter [Bradyrhizobium sp. U87765 SZCCT0131]|uniref:MFS transporter n=1 Tax=unclassified Bradyrhizobium TaxID=2631580 RepID=UPI001BACC942|nr:MULTISPECIES: MFS transporter [unclassified Bradyrhizobium]MBR1218108.1 MFS transporter [Bradyrhizobium sp. U87765 SZCCT0131]MBR1260946.1 MFS transporter [Bradyrhizobium sp. U87765 SZCCT0134]MBR1303606.1 MFS transporter [Bradyrhizobium sp. U87765 SZCCT0110]MBR1319212.1 MFS transporter [Bradyrhizobium sp. U87765 SZCCT0109]MBR1347537.1 MFS transporter [Bradyrhizobium sp. U87765 SZCCT0048]
MSADAVTVTPRPWRTPLLIIACGGLIGMLTFGPRSTFGFFIQPMSHDLGWGRDVFAFALAVQNLLWGLGQPFAGAIADRFGTLRVLSVGALMYAAGLLLMRYSGSPTVLTLSTGVLIGFGLSGCSFNLVLAAFSKLVPPHKRNLSLGVGTAAGSFGQFLFAPVSVALIDTIGWPATLTMFAALMLLVVPLSFAVATPPAASIDAPAEEKQSFTQALSEAFGHRSYVLLVIGFFTCGFQLAFVTAHLPAYLVDRGMAAQTGGWVLAVIGLFNMVGSIGVGWLSSYFPKRYILSTIYFVRAMSVVAFISLPITTTSAILFGIVTGLTWLSSVPPTSSLISLMFGTRWLATLYGFAFVSHQVGGFLGAWFGGLAFNHYGSYNVVWWLSVLFGVLSALINLPIVEKPVLRAAAEPA